ncbi:MAG: DUF167 domain-containing protein [Coriobacteriales bacterium]|nr:DUF167 domain-containing protein [Coriobacteriales bacterium]
MITLAVKVIPKSAHNAIVGWSDIDSATRKELIIRLTAPPTDGQANGQLVTFLAKCLNIPKTSIHIISGQGSRHKRLRLDIDTAQLDLLVQDCW